MGVALQCVARVIPHAREGDGFMAEVQGQLALRGLEFVAREAVAGISAVATGVPSCLAAGLLVFAPLGPDYVAKGVAAGLCSAIFAAPAAAFAARSPWLMPTPRSSTAVI